MKITVSHMVCSRCVIVTESILEKLGFRNFSVNMGEIELSEQPSEECMTLLKEELERVGFEIVEDKTEKIIQAIKASLVEYLEQLAQGKALKMSAYVRDKLPYEYSYLSDLFSKTENKTIEKYFIELRLDRAKEMLKYSDKDLSYIAYALGYSSPQHFASQFKQHIGMTPSAFRAEHKN